MVGTILRALFVVIVVASSRPSSSMPLGRARRRDRTWRRRNPGRHGRRRFRSQRAEIGERVAEGVNEDGRSPRTRGAHREDQVEDGARRLGEGSRYRRGHVWWRCDADGQGVVRCRTSAGLTTGARD